MRRDAPWSFVIRQAGEIASVELPLKYLFFDCHVSGSGVNLRGQVVIVKGIVGFGIMNMSMS